MTRFSGLTQTEANAYRSGAVDAYGNTAERTVSDGEGNPCRCCLKLIPKGAAMLVLAHRPFAALQPYAETGPIFLCAEHCNAHQRGFPEVLTDSPDYLLKGYGQDERIIYGTGQITASDEIERYAAELLERECLAFVDVRSARNNCWQARIMRED